MKIKIKLWKPKEQDWQLRITCGGVLVERDQGVLEAMLNHCHFYGDMGKRSPEFTTNIFGANSRVSAEADLDLRKVLTKKERQMLNWAAEEA